MKPYSLLAFLALVVVAVADMNPPNQWSWHNFPNPQDADGMCGLPKGEKSWVCDPNNLLGSQDSVRQLNGLMEKIFNHTKCPCSPYTCEESHQGFSFAVALLPFIQKVQDGQPIQGREEVWDNLQLAHMFSMHTYKKWNLGKCENSVFIVYSKQNGSGVVYTLTGTTTAKKLTNNDVVKVTSNVLPQFIPNPDSLFRGLWKMISDYRAVLNGTLVLGTAPPMTPQAVVGGTAPVSLPHILVTMATTALAVLYTQW